MSHLAYNNQWCETHNTIQDLLEVEQPAVPPKPEKDRIAVFQHLAVIYIKYIQIFRKIEECYDQIVHPQKQIILRTLLDSIMGRILELKNNMVVLELSEFHYMDDVLSDLKLTPDDLEIVIPKYFISENKHEIKEKLGLNPIVKTKEQNFKKLRQEVIKLTREESVRLIQIHERARQGRLRAKFMKEIRLQEERERLAASRESPMMDPRSAALLIQKIWRGFITRKRTSIMREEELVFIGMKPAPTKEYKDTPMFKVAKTCEQRRIMHVDNVQEYAKALIAIKDKIRDVEGPEMREDMQDQIRQWFIECRDATGKFPEYPSEQQGGSNAIFKEKDPEQQMDDEEKEESTKGKNKEKGKEGKGKKEKDKGKDKKAKKGEEEEDPGITFEPSIFVSSIADMDKSFREVWQDRDESANFKQKHDEEIIKEQKRTEIEGEVRIQIDELMRQELKNLKLAVDRDKGKKRKKSGKKGGKKKKKGGKKSGKKGGKKKKKDKDLTADRTLESLCEELKKAGVLVKPPHVQLKEYIGEYNYLGSTLRQSNIEPMPSLSDVRRVVTEFCILPLGSQTIHERAPLIKSVLLAGPRGCGKKMLLHTICTETGALLFDLTATNIVGLYPGKAGLQMLLHIVFKIARLLPPAVVYIGECEKTFQKKIPKTDKTEPKRLKKDLTKLVKGMKAKDRILLVGISTEPFNAEVKPFCTAYQKVLLIPRPDYASRYLLWPHLIKKHGGEISDTFDVSSLAKITDGYTPGHMVSAIKSVLTNQRLKQLPDKPISASEFVPALAKIEPIYLEEEQTFKTWYTKTPLGKKRAKAARIAEGDDDKKEKEKKGKKKK